MTNVLVTGGAGYIGSHVEQRDPEFESFAGGGDAFFAGGGAPKLTEAATSKGECADGA